MANVDTNGEKWIDRAAKSSAAIVVSRAISFVGAPMAALIGIFVWDTLLEVQDYVRRNDTEIQLLSQRVTELEKDAAAAALIRYTNEDAVRDLHARDQKDAEQDRRIESLEDDRS